MLKGEDVGNAAVDGILKPGLSFVGDGDSGLTAVGDGEVGEEL